MSRPYKLNETPTAPFSLRETGPLKLADVARRLNGATYRTARGARPDGRATVDPKPCPHCGSLVEWSTTAKLGPKGENVRYVYARCRGHKQHRWSFSGAPAPTPPTPENIEPVSLSVPPRPSAGASIMGEWIAGRVALLEAELMKLRTIEQLAQEVTGRAPTAPVRKPVSVAAPRGDVEPNGTPPGMPHGYRPQSHN